ncbi:6766_t:CDS:2 [Dentiscutata heterogama]|uniref:6766_t:CDS:1 n=1 Tax=Dentiscutata heterogama TaxID=1316150 RepID=A0ACA9JZL0_9GLOM|nr:6766_t:CDS:2 [Dentiscutata heterogama]
MSQQNHPDYTPSLRGDYYKPGGPAYVAAQTLGAVQTVGDAITPFIPLFTMVANVLKQMLDIYDNAKCNEKICAALLDRVEIAQTAVKSLQRKYQANEKNFRNQDYYHAWVRFVNVLENIRKFAKEVTQLTYYQKFINANAVKEAFEKNIKEFEEVCGDLNFTMAMYNAEQREIEAQNVAEDLEILKKSMDDMKDEIKAEIRLAITEISMDKMGLTLIEEYKAPSVDPKELQDPFSSKDNVRGTNKTVRKKIFRGMEVACKKVTLVKGNYGPFDHANLKKQQNELAALLKLFFCPYIINFYGISYIENSEVMIYDWAPYSNLREMYSKYDIDWPTKLRFARDIFNGLVFMHQFSLYHHDVRCENILVTHGFEPKISNLGTIIGTTISRHDIFRWLAPEMMRKSLKGGTQRYNHQCEMYSFGMMLWELCHQRFPYDDMEDISEIQEHVLSKKREAFENSLCPSPIQKELYKLIKRAWDVEPSARPSDMEMQHKLKELYQEHLDKINGSKDIDEIKKIKKQVNDGLDKIKGSNYVNELIKHKIKFWLDWLDDLEDIKVSDNVYKINDLDEIDDIKVLDNVYKINDLDEIDDIKVSDNKYKINDLDDIDNIKVSDIVYKIIKQLKYWLDKIKDSEDLDKIIIKVSDNVDEIIKQLKHWLDKINYSEVDKIKKQINDQLDKIKGAYYVNKIIKHQIKYWLDEIKGSDIVDKIIKFIYWLNKIEDSDIVGKIINLKHWFNKIEDSEKLNEITIKAPINLNKIINQFKYWFDEINDSDVDEIKKQINDQLDKIKDSDYVNEIIKHQIKCWLDEINVLDLVDRIIKLKYWIYKIKDSKKLDKLTKKVSNNLDEIINLFKSWLNNKSDSKNVNEIKKQINDQLDNIKDSDYINEFIKYQIKCWLKKINDSNDVKEIIKQLNKINDSKKLGEIMIKVSVNVDEIIKQLKDWLDKINGSGVDEIRKQINYQLDEIKDSNYINEFIKHKIKCLLDEIKVSDIIDKIIKLKHWFEDSEELDEIIIKISERLTEVTTRVSKNLDEIIKPLKYWLDEINDSEDVEEIKEQINDQLDKIRDSDYITEIINHKIKCWLDKIKVSDNVNEIKKQEISYWFDKIEGSDDVDEIIKQLKYQSEDVNKIKDSDNVDEIIKQLKYWINKIKGSEDVERLKKRINDQLDKIKGSDDIDKIKGSDDIDKIIKQKIKCWLDEVKVSDDINEIKKCEISYWLDKIKGSDNIVEIERQIKYWLNERKSSDDIDKIKMQIECWTDKIKGPNDIDEIKKLIDYQLSKIKGLDNVTEITNQFLESDKIISELPLNTQKHTDKMYTSKTINTQQISKILSKPIENMEIPEDC